MAKRQVGKCRFYADIPSYLKILGSYGGSEGFYTEEEGADLVDAFPLDNPENVWQMNPSQTTTYEVPDVGFPYWKFWINTQLGLSDGELLALPQNRELSELITNIPSSTSSGLYAGILGHNIGTNTTASLPQITIGGYERVEESVDFGADEIEGTDDDTITEESTTLQLANGVSDWNEIVNFPIGGGTQVEHNGYSLIDITGFQHNVSHVFNIGFNTDVASSAGEVDIGAFTYGRWFEPEHAFDIKATIDHSYDGVKLQNTVGGSTLSNISYLGQNNWGNLPAWTLEKQLGHDYNIGANKARRSWRVGLSYLTDDNLFDKAGNENKFFTWNDPDTSEEGTPEYVFDSSLSSFFKLSLMGKLPFIFCPDSSADDLEFALCRITNKPSFKQVANNLFSTSLVITETY